uniref:(northern house mosquito) hypothetical protein n=1 Tax=Culex pipiens TaxID=7175 RepID=A0A8D8E028_CULPI
MASEMKKLQAIRYNKGKLEVLDQLLLPAQTKTPQCLTLSVIPGRRSAVEAGRFGRFRDVPVEPNNPDVSTSLVLDYGRCSGQPSTPAEDPIRHHIGWSTGRSDGSTRSRAHQPLPSSRIGNRDPCKRPKVA